MFTPTTLIFFMAYLGIIYFANMGGGRCQNCFERQSSNRKCTEIEAPPAFHLHMTHHLIPSAVSFVHSRSQWMAPVLSRCELLKSRQNIDVILLHHNITLSGRRLGIARRVCTCIRNECTRRYVHPDAQLHTRMAQIQGHWCMQGSARARARARTDAFAHARQAQVSAHRRTPTGKAAAVNLRGARAQAQSGFGQPAFQVVCEQLQKKN